MLGHSHLDQRRSNLVVGSLNVPQIGFADGFADNGGDFVVVEIALALKFLRLLAAEVESQKSVGGCGSDVASGNHGKFQIGRTGPIAVPAMRIAPTCPSVFSIK